MAAFDPRSTSPLDWGSVLGMPMGSALMVEFILPSMHSFVLEWVIWAGLTCFGWALYGLALGTVAYFTRSSTSTP